MRKLLLILFVCSAFAKAYAQFDIARVEAVHIPQGDNQDFEFTKIRALFNVPIKLKEGRHLILGADYSVIDIVQIEALDFSTKPLRDFQTFEFNFGLTQKLKNNWRMVAMAKPGVTTNSVKNTSFLKAMRLSGGLLFYKDEKVNKNYDLLVGIFYNAFNGFSYPLPYLKYHKIINQKWSYDLGFPKMNLEYMVAPKHALKAYATIDGFNSNLIETLAITEGNVERFNARVVVAGLKYDYTIREHVEWYFATGYIFDSAINLRDRNAESLIKINSENAIYLRTGIRIKI